MATARKLYPGEEPTCHYCDNIIKNTEYDDAWVVEIGDPSLIWHAECADSVGVPIEQEEDDADDEFEIDPDLDGPFRGMDGEDAD